MFFFAMFLENEENIVTLRKKILTQLNYYHEIFFSCFGYDGCLGSLR